MKNEVKVHCELGTKGRNKIGTIFGLKKSTTEKNEKNHLGKSSYRNTPR